MAKSDSISAKEADLIAGKIMEVAFMLKAMHEVATECGNAIASDTVGTVVATMSKQGLRTLDACIGKLGGIPLGNFSDEFDADNVDGEKSHG